MSRSAITAATGLDAGEPEVRQAAAAAEGSVGRALGLLDGAAIALRQRMQDLLEQLPDPDPRALHALGEAIGGTDPRTLEAFMDMVNGWLSTRLDTRLGEGTQHTAQLARVAETWEKVNRAARDVETYNLERKPLVFRVFGALAEAART